MGKGQLTRQAVLDQAARTASEVGLRGVTIGSLAELTHMSKSGLFAHFGSKESLQLATVRYARDQFVNLVIRPALAAPRGSHALGRSSRTGWNGIPMRCQAAVCSSRLRWNSMTSPVQSRDELVRNQADLDETIARVFRGGITARHFRDDADPEQFAFHMHGILLAFHQHSRLLGDPLAAQRARRALDALLDAARP